MYLLRWEPVEDEILEEASALAAEVGLPSGRTSAPLRPIAVMLFRHRIAAALWGTDRDEVDFEIATRPELANRGIERLLVLTFLGRCGSGRRAVAGSSQPAVAALLPDLGFVQVAGDRWILDPQPAAFFEMIRGERRRLEQAFQRDRGTWPSAGVARSKHIAQSSALGRSFHADMFDVGADPALLVLAFGGSGVSKQEYMSREGSILTWLDRPLAELADEGRSFRVVYVTAPYDQPLADLIEDEEAARRWTRHVEEDLLTLGPGLPLYLLGYSGGATLALCGAHLHDLCIGVGAIGGDGIPGELEEGSGWLAPLRLQYGGHDRVYSVNSDAIAELVEAEVAVLLRRGEGGHSLEDYVSSGAIGGQLRHALRLVQAAG